MIVFNKKEDILFFVTMSDGDYMEEMLDESIKMMNSSSTIAGFPEIAG